METWLVLVLLFAAGLFAGILNVVAGGGSFLTLPLLIFAGLPAGVANGTNRVGIVLQNVAAVWSFRRHGIREPGSLWWAVGPAVPGGVLGAWIAVLTSDAAFKRTLAVLMVIFTLVTLWSPRPRKEGDPPPSRQRLALIGLGFFLAGIYAGFVQAGVGFLLMALTTLAGLDLVRGNAVKVFAVLCLTILALGIFMAKDLVDWPYGLALGVGNFLGGIAGARLTVLKGHAWVQRVVTVMVVLFAIKLWLEA